VGSRPNLPQPVVAFQPHSLTILCSIQNDTDGGVQSAFIRFSAAEPQLTSWIHKTSAKLTSCCYSTTTYVLLIYNLLHCMLAAAQYTVIGSVCWFVCGSVTMIIRIVCIDPQQTGFVGKGSDHLQLIKFWPSCATGKGSAAGQKFLASPYYSQRAVFASFWALFHFAWNAACRKTEKNDRNIHPHPHTNQHKNTVFTVHGYQCNRCTV